MHVRSFLDFSNQAGKAGKKTAHHELQPCLRIPNVWGRYNQKTVCRQVFTCGGKKHFWVTKMLYAFTTDDSLIYTQLPGKAPAQICISEITVTGGARLEQVNPINLAIVRYQGLQPSRATWSIEN